MLNRGLLSSLETINGERRSMYLYLSESRTMKYSSPRRMWTQQRKTQPPGLRSHFCIRPVPGRMVSLLTGNHLFLVSYQTQSISEKGRICSFRHGTLKIPISMPIQPRLETYGVGITGNKYIKYPRILRKGYLFRAQRVWTRISSHGCTIYAKK